MATGRSDYPNQINYALRFPRFLDSRTRTVNDEMKLAAAVTPSELSEEYIISSVFNTAVVPVVTEGVARTRRAWHAGADDEKWRLSGEVPAVVDRDPRL